MELSEFDRICFQRAVELAKEAHAAGNLPIGAVIAFQGEIIGEGRNAIWSPELSLSRHAEMEAMRSVPAEMWQHAPDMALYTTLEPCLMCMGAILLHGIGRILYGSTDPYGGACTVVDSLPQFFKEQLAHTEWIGPAFPEACDPLYDIIKSLEKIE